MLEKTYSGIKLAIPEEKYVSYDEITSEKVGVVSRVLDDLGIPNNLSLETVKAIPAPLVEKYVEENFGQRQMALSYVEKLCLYLANQ